MEPGVFCSVAPVFVIPEFVFCHTEASEVQDPVSVMPVLVVPMSIVPVPVVPHVELLSCDPIEAVPVLVDPVLLSSIGIVTLQSSSVVASEITTLSRCVPE
jgi:hypothetical protein